MGKRIFRWNLSNEIFLTPADGFTRRNKERKARGLSFINDNADAHLSYLSSIFSTAIKASCGTSTLPTCFMRFLPSFCFSSSFRFREMSPP